MPTANTALDSSSAALPLLLSLQIGLATPMLIEGRSFLSGIHKTPVTGKVAVQRLGLAGDEQADLSVHGGLSKALYAYPQAHYAFWRARLEGHNPSFESLSAGAMGENLTLQGLLEEDAYVGDVLRFSQCALRITEPRQPCFKFNAAMGYNLASKHMAQSGHCGFYLAVEEEGFLSAGEAFTLEHGARQTTIAELFKGKMHKHLR